MFSLLQTSRKIAQRFRLSNASQTNSLCTPQHDTDVARRYGDLEEVWPLDMQRAGPPACGHALGSVNLTPSYLWVKSRAEGALQPWWAIPLGDRYSEQQSCISWGRPTRGSYCTCGAMSSRRREGGEETAQLSFILKSPL
ncbi:hypothetical protein ACOMHN_019078 [Nucella lapillus]